MACHCLERRVAIGRAVSAAIRGDHKAVTREARFVGSSAVEDVRAALKRRETIVRLARLSGRR